MELRRDPEFRLFCSERLPGIRQALPNLPAELEGCLATEMSPGLPLAKFLLDAYNLQASEPQWQRLRRAATAGSY
jgi:hypothetical protein